MKVFELMAALMKCPAGADVFIARTSERTLYPLREINTDEAISEDGFVALYSDAASVAENPDDESEE